jgi:hypothetical protein
MPETEAQVRLRRRDRLDREARRGDVVKTARDRAEKKRAEKLELVREQVKSGSLAIRQMTDEERRRYPPRPPQSKRPGR